MTENGHTPPLPDFSDTQLPYEEWAQRMRAVQSLVFEPHNLYGATLDGEPMPFGYISGGIPRVPIFELNPPLQFNADLLKVIAQMMAAAP